MDKATKNALKKACKRLGRNRIDEAIQFIIASKTTITNAEARRLAWHWTKTS